MNSKSVKPGIGRESLATTLATLLKVSNFQDYCPNGLQVEGGPWISSVVTGVTASHALIEAAIEARAQAVIVHHGYFWRGEDSRVCGPMRRRLHALLTHDLNLFAYHLPLDAHPQLGNNAQLAKRLGLKGKERFGAQGLGWIGTHARAKTLGELTAIIGQVLGRTPIMVGEPDRRIRKIAWCSGDAQSMLIEASAAGCDVFISGELSEPTTHLARESGTAYLACGHHATERYGIAALGDHLAKTCGLDHRFIDIPNPA